MTDESDQRTRGSSAAMLLAFAAVAFASQHGRTAQLQSRPGAPERSCSQEDYWLYLGRESTGIEQFETTIKLLGVPR